MTQKKEIYHIHFEDVVQLFFGALIFGIPASYTQETWDLGAELGLGSIFLLFLLSTFLIALAVFQAGYHVHSVRTMERIYVQRVLLSYFCIFVSCTIFLVLIGKAPWFTEPLLALQRTVLISVPGAISGITADIIR